MSQSVRKNLRKLWDACLEHLILAMFFAVLVATFVDEAVTVFFPLGDWSESEKRLLVGATSAAAIWCCFYCIHAACRFQSITAGKKAAGADAQGPGEYCKFPLGVPAAVFEQDVHFLPPAWMVAACGFILPYMAIHPAKLGAFTLAILFLTWVNLRWLMHHLIRNLAPGAFVTWPDMLRLGRGYLMLITASTLLNASLELLHRMAGAKPAFGFAGGENLVADSLYFSLVVMTTLGFGDITPQTIDAKILVGLESLSSYVVFALLVGVVTRGILPPDNS